MNIGALVQIELAKLIWLQNIDIEVKDCHGEGEETTESSPPITQQSNLDNPLQLLKQQPEALGWFFRCFFFLRITDQQA